MLNPQFPNYANGAAGTEVIGWTIVGGQPLYRLPVAYVDTGFGAAFVCEGSTVEAPTYPDGVYNPDPNIESAGTISGTPDVGETLTFTPGTISGTTPITATYNWIRYIPGGTSLIVGTGLSYTVQIADVTHMLIVQTVASNSVGTVATQTVPFGPCTAASPIITNPGTVTVRGVNDPAYCPVPGDVLEYSGLDIFYTGTYTTYITWVNANNPDEVWQLGGDTFTIPDRAVGDEVEVFIVVFGVGSSTTVSGNSNAIAVCGSLDIVTPSKITLIVPLYVDTVLTGVPATFASYGPVTKTFGFFDVTDPNNPLPLGSPNSTTYLVRASDIGKEIAFRTVGTIGVLTETSITAALGPVDGFLDVLTRPTISQTTDIVYAGATIKGTPGTFQGVPAPTSVTSGFYRVGGTTQAPTYTLISATGVTEYVVQPGDVGTRIVYGSSAVSDVYPSGLLSVSPTEIKPKNFFTFTTTGSYTNNSRPGQTPRVGDSVSFVHPQSSPQNNQYGGTVPLTSFFYSRVPGQTTTYGAPTNPYTIPATWYGREFWVSYTANFEGDTYKQDTSIVIIGGVPPVIGGGGSVTPSDTLFPYTPGTNAIFTKPAVTAGAPAAYTDSWTWYSVKAGGARTALQSGGLTLTTSSAMVNQLIEVDYTVTNAAGSDKKTYVASAIVPPPKVIFTSIGQLSGTPTFTQDAFGQSQLILTYSSSTATDGSADPITITKQFVLCDAVGNKVAGQPILTDNKPSAGSVTILNTGLSERQDLPDPPGDPNQIPTPCAGRYFVIVWTATNPKTGSTATAKSNILGPLVDAARPYAGTSPPAFSAVKPNPQFSSINCTIQLPTYNNGGVINASSVKVWTVPVGFPAYVISTGSLTFTTTESTIYGPGGSYMTATVTGPSGSKDVSFNIYN